MSEVNSRRLPEVDINRNRDGNDNCNVVVFQVRSLIKTLKKAKKTKEANKKNKEPKK